MTNKNVLELCKAWFEKIAERCSINKTTTATTADTREYVDLGLPSGKLWATENEKGYFTFKKACKKFGDMMPSKEDFVELFRNCTCEWDYERQGILFTGPNKKTLFFYASGYRLSSLGSMLQVGSNGYYWSSSPSDASGYILYFSSWIVDPSNAYAQREAGYPVRLIINKK